MADDRTLGDIQQDAADNFMMLKAFEVKAGSVKIARLKRQAALWSALNNLGIPANGIMTFAKSADDAAKMFDDALQDQDVVIENREMYDDPGRRGFYLSKAGELVHFISIIKQISRKKCTFMTTIKPEDRFTNLPSL